MITPVPSTVMTSAAEVRRRGLAAARLQDYTLAEKLLLEAAKLEPLSLATHVNLAAVFQALGECEKAIVHSEIALSIDPARPEIHNNLAMALISLRRFDEAIVSAARAISLRSDYPEAYNNLGTAWYGKSKLERAAVCYREAIGFRPDYQKAIANLGVVLQELNRLDEALSCFERALSLAPDSNDIAGLDLHLRMRLCRWEGLTERLQSVRQRLEDSVPVATPFAVLGAFDDPALHRQVATLAAARWQTSSGTAWQRNCLYIRPNKIRVAYFSADFFNHATTHLIAGLISSHDRHRFEILGFSFGPKHEDPHAKKISGAFDQFFEVDALSDREIAQHAQRLAVDVAVDLKGYTKDSRPGVFAARAAPIQVNFLGYPGTMAAPFIDYLIADDTLVPERARHLYDERVVFMPKTYQVNDSRRIRPSRDLCPSRHDLGLPNDAFVYCCFNNSFKITPETFSIWGRILAEVKNAVLWLLADNPAMEVNLRAQAQGLGIDPARLCFAPRLPLEQHLARHHAADLFLDTLPYNAHTTSSDALWMGVPVVTRIGESFPARVAASLLRAADLADLITDSAQAYEALAVCLALDPVRLASLRLHLEQNRLTMPLFDTAGFARSLESAFEIMVNRWHAGAAPGDIRP